jgi:hypothetical protein
LHGLLLRKREAHRKLLIIIMLFVPYLIDKASEASYAYRACIC